MGYRGNHEHGRIGICSNSEAGGKIEILNWGFLDRNLKGGFAGLKSLLRTDIDDELHDLQPCDPFLPPDPDAPSTLEIVPIHDHMNK